VVGRLHQGKRQHRKTAAVGRSGPGFRLDATSSAEAGRGPIAPNQPGVVAASIHAGVRRFCRALLRASFLSNTQTFHAKTLPSNSNNSPLACFWKLSASRHRNCRPAAIRVAKNGRRFGMGIRQSFAQSRLQGLRTSEAMELSLGSQSRKWRFASRENSGSRKTRSHTRTDSSPIRIAQGASSHQRAPRHFDRDAGRGNSRSAPKGRRLCDGRDSYRTSQLSRLVRTAEDQRQQAITSHSQSSRRTARACMWTPRADRRRALGISISPWQAAQRFESPAPAFETGRCEDRSAMAQLAHLEADSRDVVASGWSFSQGCTSATRSQQNVHDTRGLHGADSCAFAGSGRKPFAIGDEW
jgi:hypothetical protein